MILEKNKQFSKVKITMKNMIRLKRDFFDREVIEVAQNLLGKVIVTNIKDEITAGRIVEVEAYYGVADKASHIYGNKITERNRGLLKPPGFIYIYRIYGRYLCFNIVTGGIKGSSVFIRAVEPLDGLEVMQRRRGLKKVEQLTSGPSKLCIAMGISIDLNENDIVLSSLIGVYDDGFKNTAIEKKPRINIDYAGEDAAKLLRFYIKNNKFVSRR